MELDKQWLKDGFFVHTK